MAKYTIADVGHIVPVEQTRAVIEAIENYLNTGEIPPYDPCVSCEPAHARRLVSLIQVAERNGLWPPKRETAKPKTTVKAKAKEDWVDDGYVAGVISADELEKIKEKRPEMFTEIEEN